MEWYQEHLGIEPQGEWGTSFEWRELEGQKGYTVWGPMSEGTDYFDPSRAPFMINYRVKDLRGLVERLRSDGVDATDVEEHPQGLFAWAMDPEGRRLELWEQPEESETP
jgi:predicted enzyme related to lactoylglutathione lyase